ncbi:restriction endonuclease subunit S [Metamycoplasma hominis]|uniref:restriction endonuclease subunit S n=1 Tax=Metamycoplasma hominis TaxID=2098 RepID=UPI0022AB0127|nr:restriction endonuclease subunit S [Metamycoplasma hominis]MCZ2781631.1 hypothetical protein [Metamycoplasma hominis]
MSAIVWKGFKLGDLFTLSTKHVIKKQIKNLVLYQEWQEGRIANITASEKNNGIAGYIEESEETKLKQVKNSLTLNPDGSAGVCFYHNYYFVSTGHNKLVKVISNDLKILLDKNPLLYLFLSKSITKIFYKTFFSFSKAITDEDFCREIILLPCLEVTKNDEWIWQENEHYYTLAVEYIKKLMEKAKELNEQKTIRLYEAERVKYEAERVKYEAGYNKQRNILAWKGFKLGELFTLSTEHVIKKQIKNLVLYQEWQEGRIANITASEKNNGIAGYIEESEETKLKQVKNSLTLNPDGSAGVCFYHNYYFVSTGHNKLVKVISNDLKILLDTNPLLYLFLSKSITQIFYKTFFGFSKTITDEDFCREIILLPCLEVTKNDEWIWQENEHYYTLAVEYISYIYLSGKVDYNQKLIDQYALKIKAV